MNSSYRQRIPLMVFAFSALGFLLRLIQRRVSLGENGLHSAKLLWPLIVLSFLLLLFAFLTCSRLRPRPGFRENHLRSTTSILTPISALLFLASALLRLFSGSGTARWLVGLTGVVGALCLLVIGLFVLERRQPSFFLYAGLTISLICRLIPEFRAFSVDPRISDYCFQLFAMIAVMLVAFQLGGFSLDHGQRRAAAFFSELGVFFAMISVADGGLQNILFYLFCAFFQLAALTQLLQVPRRRRRVIRDLPEEPEDVT